MSLIIAVALPLPVRISSSIINVEFGVFVCPEDMFACISASISREKHHSRPKIYRCHAILGDHGKFPLIENHFYSMEKFHSPDNKSYCPGLHALWVRACSKYALILFILPTTRVLPNTCDAGVCKSAHGLHATSRFPQI